MRTDYKASLDLTSKLITSAIFGMVLWLLYRILIHAQNKAINEMIGLIVVFLILSAVFVFSYLWHPKSYTVTDYSVIIQRKLKPLELKINQINDLQEISKSDLSGTIRTFGVGGLFGYFGKFYNRKYGTMNWYVTQNKNRVLIELKNGKKYIISPDDQKFTENLRKKLR